MPSKVRKRIIFFSLFTFLFLIVAYCIAINQPKFITKTALYFLNKHHSDVIFKDISIDQLHWNSYEKVSLKNVSIKCKVKGRLYRISIGDLSLDHLSGVLFSSQPLKFNTNNMYVNSADIRASDIQSQGSLYFNSFKYKHLDMFILIPKLEWKQYLFKNFNGNITDNGQSFTFSNVKARSYGGDLRFKGYVKYFESLSYNIEVLFDEVDSSLMTETNSVFTQLTVVIKGAVVITNQNNKGLSIQADFQAPSGGHMKASLLKYLAQYVPQRKQIEDLIIKDADVALDKAQMTIASLNSDKLSTDVFLNSSSLNLNIKVKFDIHVDGGLDRLLRYTQ